MLGGEAVEDEAIEHDDEDEHETIGDGGRGNLSRTSTRTRKRTIGDAERRGFLYFSP